MKSRLVRYSSIVALSVALAIVIMLGMVIAEKQFENRVPWFATAAPLWAGTAAGMAILVREFRWYSLLIGLAYIPLLYGFLLWVGLLFVGNVYGDWL